MLLVPPGLFSLWQVRNPAVRMAHCVWFHALLKAPLSVRTEDLECRSLSSTMSVHAFPFNAKSRQIVEVFVCGFNVKTLGTLNVFLGLVFFTRLFPVYVQNVMDWVACLMLVVFSLFTACGGGSSVNSLRPLQVALLVKPKINLWRLKKCWNLQFLKCPLAVSSKCETILWESYAWCRRVFVHLYILYIFFGTCVEAEYSLIKDSSV